MDNTFSVSDGTTTHAFGVTSLTAGKSDRLSRSAAANKPIKATVQQSLKNGVQRSNIKFQISYTDAQGVTKYAQRSVSDTFEPGTLAAADATVIRNLSKNFLADATLSAQYLNGEL